MNNRKALLMSDSVYRDSFVMNEKVVERMNKLSEKTNAPQKYTLFQEESFRSDGIVQNVYGKCALELKRRCNDTAISDYVRNGYYKWSNFQIMDGYSVRLGKDEITAFLVYDNELKGCLQFTSECINYDVPYLRSIKGGDGNFHNVIFYSVDLNHPDCHLIDLETLEVIK